jgi:hypothetical protein
MTSKHKNLGPFLALAFGVAVAHLGCEFSTSSGDSPGKVDIECQGGEPTTCQLTHTEGASDLRVCWDLRFTCVNGAIVEARGICQDVEVGRSAVKSIPLSAFSNAAACDRAPTLEILNLMVSPK